MYRLDLSSTSNGNVHQLGEIPGTAFSAPYALLKDVKQTTSLPLKTDELEGHLVLATAYIDACVVPAQCTLRGVLTLFNILIQYTLSNYKAGAWMSGGQCV